MNFIMKVYKLYNKELFQTLQNCENLFRFQEILYLEHMIKEYLKKEFVQKISDNCCLFKAVKDNSHYFMYEYTELNQCDEYNFKVIKKLVTCSHVLGVIQKFTQNNKTYFITEFTPSDLLREQMKSPNKVFSHSKAVQIFAKIVQIIEEIHQSSIIYRNFRLETLGLKDNELFLSDFRLSQIVKRRQRYFEVVGVSNYLAPQFYSEDGYGFEVDVWAAGVCLFYMLTGGYPFSCEGKNEEEIVQQMSRKCKKGFHFQANSDLTKKQKLIRNLQDLFKRIFQMDYRQRITIPQLKQHPTIKEFFENQQQNPNACMLSVIEQEQSTNLQYSIFMSMLNKFPCHYEFHKEEIIFDFMEHSSEILMLDSPTIITEEIRSLVNFSILKVAVFKANNFIDILYGKKEPNFKINPKDWENMKQTPAFMKVKQKIERKKKILEMLFRAACLSIKNFRQKSFFYSDQIPPDFSAIKQQILKQISEYRKNLSRMFEVEKEIMKKKESKQKVRKSCENLGRLTILCMINRIFEEPQVRQNFQFYFSWSRKQSMEGLEEWIQNEKLTNLKNFVKNITSKYLE